MCNLCKRACLYSYHTLIFLFSLCVPCVLRGETLLSDRGVSGDGLILKMLLSSVEARGNGKEDGGDEH